MPRANAPGYQSLATRSLRYLLMHGPATIAELAEEFDATPKAVRDGMYRLRDAGAVRCNDTHTRKVWSAVQDSDDMYSSRVRKHNPVLIKPKDAPTTKQRNWFDL